MSTTNTVGVEIDDLRSELATGVNPESWALHKAALAILHAHDRLLSYTADEYFAAVKQAERKTGLGDVHTAMAGRQAYV